MSEVCRTQIYRIPANEPVRSQASTREVSRQKHTAVLLVLLLVLLIPTVLWYMYESVPQYQYWLTDFAVCRYIPSVYSICACASLHAHCK